MSITIDDQPLAAGEFKCVGDVLEHVRERDKSRLIVKVLLDGAVPDFTGLNEQDLKSRTLYVETADRKTLASDALAEAQGILDAADDSRQQAIEELSAGRAKESMPFLNQWLGTWRQAQKALMESAWVVGVDVDKLGISNLVGELASQLRQIKTSLESKDYVTLSDILNYEAPGSMERWRHALQCVASQI
ncbi:MAG TPA: hypothetical protein VGG19_20125 [Tepidisphaeraceae bacterium]|jgi:hypothetical protein